MKYLGRQFIEYSQNAFGAVFILWVPIVFFFGLGGLLMFITGDFLLGFYEIGIVLFPIPLLFIAFLVDRVLKNIWVRGLIIYFVLFIIFLIIYFVFLSMIGGISMAVAEGVAGSFWQRMADYFISSMRGILFTQPIFIILTAIGMHQLKKR
ncbi:MAG: hypothetical protein V1704_00005 [Candidatus Vogelbacteria bacterium]